MGEVAGDTFKEARQGGIVMGLLCQARGMSFLKAI